MDTRVKPAYDEYSRPLTRQARACRVTMQGSFCCLYFVAMGDPTTMSLLDNPFDPAREAALVTGAGNGIGRAVAQALVGEGVRTVFADVNRDTVTAAVKTSPRPELAVGWTGDLADPAARDALLAEAQSALGRVTHFVHSASPPRR